MTMLSSVIGIYVSSLRRVASVRTCTPDVGLLGSPRTGSDDGARCGCDAVYLRLVSARNAIRMGPKRGTARTALQPLEVQGARLFPPWPSGGPPANGPDHAAENEDGEPNLAGESPHLAPVGAGQIDDRHRPKGQGSRQNDAG